MNAIGSDPLSASCIVLRSSYGKAVHMFDNEDSSPDVEVVVTGLKKTLHLHKAMLADVSSTFGALFNGGECPFAVYDSANRRVVWKVNTENDEMYGSVEVCC